MEARSRLCIYFPHEFDSLRLVIPVYACPYQCLWAAYVSPPGSFVTGSRIPPDDIYYPPHVAELILTGKRNVLILHPIVALPCIFFLVRLL